MSKKRIKIGDQFGRLTVEEDLGKGSNGRKWWRCSCSCGGSKVVKATNYLTSGQTSSCGCLVIESNRRKLEAFKNNNPPHNAQNLVGKIFGRLKVTQLSERGGRNNSSKWVCICECGNQVIKATDALNSGECRSCGCLRKDITRELSKTHGLSGSRLHKVWKGMLSRCKSNPRYFGRGIFVCEEWQRFEVFHKWAYDLYPHLDELMRNGYSIDRADNDGPYAPWNCRWATRVQQTRNRSNTLKVTVYNETISLAEAVEKYGRDVSLQCVYDRLHLLKWSIEDALNIAALTKENMRKYQSN